MIFDLAVHHQDNEMIEATYKWQDKRILAFVIHIDCINDDTIIGELRNHGESIIEMKSIQE